MYEVEKWFGPRDDRRCAFARSIVTEGSVFDAYIGPLGKRVPFAMHVRMRFTTGRYEAEDES